jgi:hypothetical protein
MANGLSGIRGESEACLHVVATLFASVIDRIAVEVASSIVTTGAGWPSSKVRGGFLYWSIGKGATTRPSTVMKILPPFVNVSTRWTP